MKDISSNLVLFFFPIGPTDLSMKGISVGATTGSGLGSGGLVASNTGGGVLSSTGGGAGGGSGGGGAGGGAKPLLSHKLNTAEMAAVRQLITGYRESAAFLLRSADELETLLIQQQ